MAKYQFLISILICFFTYISFAEESNRFTAGIAIGTSNFSTSVNSETPQNGTGFALQTRLGYRISRSLGIYMLLPSSIYPLISTNGRSRNRGLEGIIPAAQIWLTNKLWIYGGYGQGLDAPVFYDVQDDSEATYFRGTASLFGIGYDLFQTNRLTYDLQIRFYNAKINVPEGDRFGKSISLLFGINF